MPSDPINPIPLSELLRQLCQGEESKVSLRQMIDHFGHRAFGAVLFTFAIPNILPLPPGSSGVLGLPLVLVAPQLMLGRTSLYLPSWLGDRQLDRAALSRALSGFLPWLEKLEKISSPRWTGIFGPVGDRVLGLVCFLLSLILILPIPFGNMLPAAAISLLAFGLIQRDGLLAIVGYLAAASSWAVLGLSAKVIFSAARRLFAAFGIGF
jgi:hypothetical protein